MAETANQTLYRQELIKTFERRQSILRMTCTTEGVVNGNSFVFDVNGSGSRSAVTRGVNGLIPGTANDDTQSTCTLTEWHDLPKMTKFNLFAGQAAAARRAALQEESIGVINRKIDDQIITELATGTQYAGLTAEPLTVGKAMHAISVVLGNNIPLDGNIHGLLTPAAFAYLMQSDQVSSKDFVNDPKLVDLPTQIRWAGIVWMVHTALPSAGTSSEKLFVYHKRAIGHGMDVEGMDVATGYNEEQSYYWARASAFTGAKLLQNTGVCVIRHDGSGLAATA